MNGGHIRQNRCVVGLTRKILDVVMCGEGLCL